MSAKYRNAAASGLVFGVTLGMCGVGVTDWRFYFGMALLLFARTCFPYVAADQGSAS
jgi:hypothetical protein